MGWLCLDRRPCLVYDAGECIGVVASIRKKWWRPSSNLEVAATDPPVDKTILIKVHSVFLNL